MKRNNRSTTSSSTASAARAGVDDNDNTSSHHPPRAPKMSTRSKSTSSNAPTTNKNHTAEDNEDEARNPRDGGRGGERAPASSSLAVSTREEGPEASQRENCDSGMGTTLNCSSDAHQKLKKQASMPLQSSDSKKKPRSKVAAVKTETETRATEKKMSKESSSNGTNGNDDQNLASPESFDQEAMLQVVPSNHSFGGLSALKIDAGSGSGSYHGGGDTNIVRPSAMTSQADPTIDDLNLMDVDDDNPSSWDLLNQADSFGFNLLGSQGSLSFENDGDEDLHAANNDSSRGTGKGRNEKMMGDLTATVTASMDDQYHSNTQTKRTTSRDGRIVDSTIVNNAVHNWIPPDFSSSMPQQNYHHPHHPPQSYKHHGQHHPHGVIVHQRPPYHSNHHPYYNASHQYQHIPESRSDVQQQHSSYNFMDEELREDTIPSGDLSGNLSSNKDGRHKKNVSNADSILTFDNDPFKYAFGDPKKAITANSSSSGGKSDRNRRVHGGKAPTTSSQAKKRKQEDRAHGSTSTPLHHQHQAPVPTLSSKPTAKGTSDPRNHRHHRGDNKSRKANGNDRNRQPQQHGSMMNYSSNCHPPSITWKDPSNTMSDSVHNAFMPPLPTKDLAHRQKHSASTVQHQHDIRNASVNIAPSSNPPPCKEVYVTTRTPTSVVNNMTPAPMGRRGPYQAPIVASQYVPQHHSSPYNYPPHPMMLPPPTDPIHLANQAPRSTFPPPTPLVAMSGVGRPHLPQQRNKPAKGVALLALRNGKQLSRTQAPGIGWPPEEDIRLAEIMSNHKSSHVDWEALCKEPGLAGRTARECHDRWTRYLKPGSRKGQWTEEEDAIVLRMIFSNGGSLGTAGTTTTAGVQQETGGQSSSFTQWADLAPQLPGRTGKQIRDRWVNYLNPAINHLPFSREDDLLLWQGHKEHGKRWVEISVKIFHSTRSENHIKNRWYSAAFKKFIAKEIGIDAYVDSKQYEGGGRKGDDGSNMS